MIGEVTHLRHRIAAATKDIAEITGPSKDLWTGNSTASRAHAMGWWICSFSVEVGIEVCDEPHSSLITNDH